MSITYEKSIVKSKRKQNGIFYSPQNIVKLIVNKVLEQYFDKNIDFNKLQNIKILDSSCGDGIFLLESYFYLFNIYTNYFSNFENPEKFIIENNLYGVDIDNIAVELTKQNLSKISNYSCNNIKCGNSLISDSKITEKAFVWEQEFKEIIENGGFDIVVGNPPYVYSRDNKISAAEQIYYREKYSFIKHRVNTYFLFIELAFNLLKKNGYLGFIVPNTWLTVDSFFGLREFILKNTGELSIINVFDSVFSDANVDTCLLKFKKITPTLVELGEINNGELKILGKRNISEFQSPDFIINFSTLKNPLINNILEKINLNSKPLCDFAEIVMGIVAYIENEGKPKQTNDIVKNRRYHNYEKIDDTWVKYFDGKDVKRYTYEWSGQWIKYGINLARRRQENLFTDERILIKQIPSPLPYCMNAVYVNEHFVNDINSTIIIDFKISPFYVLSILNSKLLSFWFAHTFDKFQRKLFPQFKGKDLKKFPIPITTDVNIEILSNYAKELHLCYMQIYHEINTFAKRIKNNFELKKITTNIHNFS